PLDPEPGGCSLACPTVQTELVLIATQNFLRDAFQDDAFALVLVYTTAPDEKVTRLGLSEFRANTLDHDDVFQTDFCRNMVLYGCEKDDIDPDALDELSEWNVETRIFMGHSSAVKVPPVAVDASVAGLGGRVIVPSRCYYKPSVSRPLDGARISVKDNIDIAGHKTSLCNRAWMDLYPAKKTHAACVQTLLDAGAIVVGKVKLQAMIMREEPLECVEFTAPFNPRGDGYQVPSGSSHASAAGIGSYDWLDFSLGSDTNGSGRKPASYNGCFSIRPSTGILNTKGVVGFFPQFDMPVFFGRAISKVPDFISTWYGQSPMLRQPSKMPIRVLYPLDYLPTTNAAQTHLIDKFVSGLESAFLVTRTEISLAERWKGDCPDGAEHADIAEYLVDAGILPFYHDQYQNSADFRLDYEKKHGKPPFVHRALHWQWEEVGMKVSKEQRDALWRRSEIYRHWLLEKIFDANSGDSITIMVLPIEAGKPNYRDSEISSYLPLLSGYAALNMSPMMRAPEVTAPIGEIPYNSVVTKREEPLPIAVSVIGPPGTDLILTHLVEKGMKAGGLATELTPCSSPASLADFVAHSNPPSSSLLFLRGFASPQWLTTIGEKCRASPEFYRWHLAFPAFTYGFRDLYSSPLLPSSSARIFQLAIPTICSRNGGASGYEPENLQRDRDENVESMKRYFQRLRTRAKVADSVVRGCSLLSKQDHVLEQTITVEVGPPGHDWRAMVWMDNGRDLSQSVAGPWNPRPDARAWETYFLPVVVNHAAEAPHQATEDLVPSREDAVGTDTIKPTPTASKTEEEWRAAQNICLLPFQYGSCLDRELASRDALYALSELFTFAASANIQFLNFLSNRIEQELSFVAVEDIGGRSHSISLLNLKYIKALLTSHAQGFAEIVGILQNRRSLDWPRVDNIATAEKTAVLLQADFEHLLQRAKMLVRECEQGMSTLADSSVLEESRRSAEMAMTVQRLTMIGTIFIPLSFVCSMWGMNFQVLGSGSQPLWMLFASAAPVLFVTYLIPSEGPEAADAQAMEEDDSIVLDNFVMVARVLVAVPEKPNDYSLRASVNGPSCIPDSRRHRQFRTLTLISSNLR
ncbi:hypothetical protein QQS21_010363, partial [Conoideocrella luteorostrata]